MLSFVTKFINNEKMNNILFSFLIIITTFLLYRLYDDSNLILLVGGVCLIINCLNLKFKQEINCLFDKIIKYRYIVALVIFVVCLIFKLHGSSINVFSSIFTDKIDDNVSSVIIGNGRNLRSDEFNVQLPYYFSQYYNDYELTSYQMSIAGQDMILGYNAPVKDITMIAKPFTIGYILFGNEIGLSWYWCSKLILFILVMYEAVYILTQGNKKLSVLGSFLTVFSPAMQWWFSPHMYDVFFWAMTLFVLGYYFFVAQKKWLKWLVTILAICSITGFVLALFPSLQVALGLLALALLIIVLIRDREKINFKKLDIFRIVIVVLCVIGLLGWFLYNSWDQLQLLYGTVYPGARVSLGGDRKLSSLFTDLSNIISPYRDVTYLNNCEISEFYHLGVLYILYFPYIIYKWKYNKESNYNIYVGIMLFIALLIEIIFMIIGFPEWLAKITLFSYINRMNLVYSFTALLFTIWSFDIIYRNKELRNLKYGLICIVLFVIMYCMSIDSDMLNYIFSIKNNMQFAKLYYFGIIIIFAIVGVLIFIKNIKIPAYILIVLSVFSTFSINPVVSGISDLTNHPIYEVTQKIIKEDDSRWIALDSSIEQNYLLASGVKCINAVNFYPDYGKWDAIEDRENDDIYNRYAHIRLSLVEENTSYNLITPDSIQVNLNINDLKIWNVKYVFSKNDLEPMFENNLIDFEVKYHSPQEGYYIYKLTY